MKKLFFLLFILPLSTASVAQNIPALYTQLETFFNDSNFEACLKLTKEVESFSANRKDTISANALYYIGESYNQQGNLTKALTFFEREKAIREQLKATDPLSYSNTLYNLTYLYLQAGQYAKAGTYADQLIIHDKKVHDISSPEFASSVYSIADVYMQLNRFDDAEKLLKSTLKRQPKQSLNSGTLLNRLGDLYTYTGQYSKAQQNLEQSLDILFEIAGENSGEYISTAISLGILYMAQGKYPEAEEIFEVALNNINPSEVAYNTVLNNQALVYQSLGQFERSEELFQRIKKLDSAAIGTSHPDYAITLSNLAQIYCDERKYKEAEVTQKQALEILKKNKEVNTVSYARKLNNLARIYLEGGQPDKAIPILEQALSIFKKALTANSPEYASTLFNLGNANWKAGKGTAAITYLRNSASIRAKVLGKKHPKYAESMQRVAEYQWMQKQINEANKSFGEVFDNYYFQIDATFPGLTEEEKSRFYYNNIRDGFEKYNSFAVENNNQNPALVAEMYDHHINTKGAIMFATEKVRHAILSSQDSSLINLFDLWHQKREQIARNYSQNVDANVLDSMIVKADEIEKELTRRSSAFATQFDRKKYSWMDIQKALKPGEAAVEVLRFKKYQPNSSGNFTDNISYAFLIVTPGAPQPQLVLLEKGAELETKFLKFYHNSIRYNLDDTYSYKNYFEPLADALRKNNITRFYFSPDGVYNQVNINTIFNPLTQKYLLDEYDINMLTNTKELVEPILPKSNFTNPVLIGFPKFNLTKGEPEALKTETKVARNRGLTRGMRGLLRLMRGNEGISELPGTQKEINDISKLFSSQPSIFLEKQATEDIAKQVDNPAYLHIATHGYFLEDEETLTTNHKQYITNPLLKAGLILAGAENFLITGDPINDAGDDGILTAYEAMNLKLDNTRLVVLSACETGLGHVKNGEGVYGLQRALKLAGTQSIVMSLWSVDDDATQELMSTFYRELLASGDQHKSFRVAQQKIKDKYHKPFYWGAFVMVGM